MIKQSYSDKNYCVIYLIRHGETDWNKKRLMQGQVDIPLNKEGEKQAKEAAKKLASINFNLVFSSDLSRAKKTAEIITMEKKIAVQTTKVLREKNFGMLEGKHLDEILKILKTDIKKLRTMINKKAKEFAAEADKEVVFRFLTFIREVAIAYPGKNILIVSHGSLIRLFLTKIGFLTKKDNETVKIKNLAMVKFLTDGVDFFVKKTWGIEK